MTPKFVLFSLAASLALGACNNDTMSRRDVGNPDTSRRMGSSYNDTGSSGNWNTSNANKNKSMTHVSAREGNTLSEADKAFIRDAASGGLFEVNAGQKAAEKATDNQVKSIAQRMVDDHTRVNKELTDFAASKGFNETPTLNGEQNGMIARLDQLNGTDFDRYYVQTEIEDHRKDIAKFQHEASSATDHDLRTWAGKTVPTLREHLTLFEERARAMGVDTAMRSSGEEDRASEEHRTGYEADQNGPHEEDIQRSNPRSGGTYNR